MQARSAQFLSTFFEVGTSQAMTTNVSYVENVYMMMLWLDYGEVISTFKIYSIRIDELKMDNLEI